MTTFGQTNGDNSSRSTSSSEGISGIAELVREGVRKARDKLIDLSMRNAMLNFRHAETSAKHVRIVDEDLALLIGALASGKSLDVIPIPPVEQAPRDEETDEFRAALKTAKETDPDWLAAEDARRAAGNRRRTKDKVAERALRDRVRAKLGMPEWRVATDVRARARELGIDPSYDLPPSKRSTQRHHADNTLQTLFFPDRLEPKLASIHSAARALQEDAGLSALYFAVGFLEWYEQDNSTDPAYAPLVLLPVNMEKRIASGEYVYAIAGRDDDEASNVALREKLKRFAIDLPEYDPEAGIEAYLSGVAACLTNKPRWKVRRFATVGLFSFARQAMWSDLDSARWPADSRPEGHELLGQVYGDVTGEHGDNVAAVYDVDHPELESQAPALVIEADASQLSAVIDATSGKNLVIQGPPGTGKSQAITNIIANALWHGKTVLFVSEKMAALKVVKDRLDHMGLGLYCLEVHSAKASKASVLKSIRERMETPRSAANVQEVESAREALRQARQRLTEYASLINSPAGTTGLSVHQVLWGDFTRAGQEPAPPRSTTEFRLPEPLGIDRFKLAELIGLGKALDDWAMAMGAAAEPQHQPWRGVGNLNLNRFDRDRAVEVVAGWGAALGQLLQHVEILAGATSWDGLESPADASAAATVVSDLPVPAVDVEEKLLTLASGESARKSLDDWVDRCVRAHDLELQVDGICSKQALETNGEAVGPLLERATALEVANLSVDAISTNLEAARQSAARLGSLVRLMADLLSAASRDPNAPSDVKSEAMAAGYLLVIPKIRQDNLRYRSQALTAEAAIDNLGAAHELAGEVKSAAAEASFSEQATTRLADSIPSVAELRRAAGTFRSTGFLGKIFGREWRTARAVCRQTFPEEPKLPPVDAAKRLIAAAQWKDRLQRLEECAEAKAAAGRHWKGAETAFDRLIEVSEWMRSIQKVTPSGESGATELRRLAFEGGPDEFAMLVRFAEAAASLNLVDAFQTAFAARSTIHAEADRHEARASALALIVTTSQQFGIQPSQPVASLSKALQIQTEAKALRQQMAADVMATNACALVAAGSELERAGRIQATTRFAERVQSMQLPPSVARYLLQEGFGDRSSSLRGTAEDLKAAVADVDRAAGEADQLLKLRPEEWCGGPWRTAPIRTLLQKCERASQAPDALEKQIALLSTELEAASLGLSDLIRCWPTEGLRYSGVALAIEAAFYRSAAEKLMREHPVLTRHAGNTHEQVRKRFQDLDREILQLNRKMVAAQLRARSIPPGRRAGSTRDYTDNEMLTHQTGLQQPRIALRRLFSNAGNAIRAYTPCVMMSPMSVAQYLEPGRHSFDLLVIDEASQMRPEDALGAMLRCRQAVIVGDPEQLPPTDFFSASDDPGDEEVEDAPEESILELGRRCWHPMRMLEVHYRSRHQSLIAYSNREFYGERLLVYPSPVLDDPDYGVSCRKIDGDYEIGQGRNPKEAQAIVEEAAELMRTRADRSIGIVAMNQAQRDLIETLMDERATSDPDVQAYREKWADSLEDFFVKNLENVQGDERDVILISTVYGPTAEGVFRQNFGPLNRAYGHRRLNVLFTRAKRKLTVFTSLDPGHIVADGNRRGVRVLKEFLEYADRGTFTPGRGTGEEPGSDFERWFLSRLKSASYEAHPQVGVAGYRIDIGVVHPDKPGSYIMGVECDGATYHSSKSARDRDRLRQDVLEGLNWRIYRVWSTDWYRDPEREFDRLVQQIERVRTSDSDRVYS
ncbi:very-short-patch-repair endonuclease/DNA polymerase III delta prime subunit [Bradyrhizobium japonicum]|uniref:Very-short-patch-repair endonuclease/DNA polymerase III delta prime subunit n=1 Tax=Bradyrhizobium japonicum TaxID=375 RepID=A0ABV2RK25_BRAJP